jgi:hypothetical protein
LASQIKYALVVRGSKQIPILLLGTEVWVAVKRKKYLSAEMKCNEYQSKM